MKNRIWKRLAAIVMAVCLSAALIPSALAAGSAGGLTLSTSAVRDGSQYTVSYIATLAMPEDLAEAAAAALNSTKMADLRFVCYLEDELLAKVTDVSGYTPAFSGTSIYEYVSKGVTPDKGVYITYKLKGDTLNSWKNMDAEAVKNALMQPVTMSCSATVTDVQMDTALAGGSTIATSGRIAITLEGVADPLRTVSASTNMSITVADSDYDTSPDSTVTNPDGSTTTITTDKDTGTVTETTTSKPVTDEAGNTTQTITQTVTNTDGSTVQSTTETVEAANGSTTETTTETATSADGTATTTETVKATDTTGTTATKVTETNASGETTVKAEATITEKAVAEAAANDAPVTLPVEVTASTSIEIAPVVKVDVPTSTGKVNVEVPVESVTPGTVAVIVKDDGTEEIIKTTTIGENGVVVALSGSTTVKIVDNSKNFEDVQPVNHWATDAVDYTSAREIMNGTSSTTFSPDTALNRGMIAQIVHNIENNPDADMTEVFSDVTSDAWYTDAVLWAAELGIVEGYGDGTYGPTDYITREQLAAILYRYANFKGYDVSKTSDLTVFSDGGNTSAWAKQAMEWAVGSGLIEGKGNAVLDPRGIATRAEIATILMRFCENVAK